MTPSIQLPRDVAVHSTADDFQSNLELFRQCFNHVLSHIHRLEGDDLVAGFEGQLPPLQQLYLSARDGGLSPFGPSPRERLAANNGLAGALAAVLELLRETADLRSRQRLPRAVSARTWLKLMAGHVGAVGCETPEGYRLQLQEIRAVCRKAVSVMAEQQHQLLRLVRYELGDLARPRRPNCGDVPVPAGLLVQVRHLLSSGLLSPVKSGESLKARFEELETSAARLADWQQRANGEFNMVCIVLTQKLKA